MADAGDRLLAAWSAATRLGAPVGRLLVGLRRRAGREHPVRYRERFGRPGVPVPADGPVVWIHAASVGESVAVLPLVERFAAAGAAVLMTTVTVTAAAVLEGRLPPRAVHQFVPLDVAPFVDRFLDAWRPRLAVFVESELWPVAVSRLSARGIPLAIANGRMSDRSFRRWSRVAWLAGAMLRKVALCLAQTPLDGERYAALGVPRVAVTGNVKFDAAAPEAPPAAAAALSAACAGRPVFLAASTHPGEDEAVIAAAGRLAAAVPGLLTVVAPRHPERGAEIAARAAAAGLAVDRRAGGALPGPTTAVYVADTVGELGTLYALSTVAFVGGSLVPVGGHNPIEPCRAGAAVVTGPQTANFRDVYGALIAAGAAVRVEDGAGLAAAVERLLVDDAARARQVAAARAAVAHTAGAVARSFAALAPLVPLAGAAP